MFFTCFSMSHRVFQKPTTKLCHQPYGWHLKCHFRELSIFTSVPQVANCYDLSLVYHFRTSHCGANPPEWTALLASLKNAANHEVKTRHFDLLQELVKTIENDQHCFNFLVQISSCHFSTCQNARKPGAFHFLLPLGHPFLSSFNLCQPQKSTRPQLTIPS